MGEETLLMVRSPHLKINLAWSWIKEETKEAYSFLRSQIESKGFHLKAVD